MACFSTIFCSYCFWHCFLLLFLVSMCFMPHRDAFSLKCPPWKLVSDGGLEYCHPSSTIWNRCSWGGKCFTLASSRQLWSFARDVETKRWNKETSSPASIDLWSTAERATDQQSRVVSGHVKFFVLFPRLTDFFWCSESDFVSSTIWNRLQWRTDLILPWRGFCN